MKPYNIYAWDLITRGLYFLFSYIFCLVIFFYRIETVFLAEVYPLLILLNKRFITTNITDFIDTAWCLSIFMSTLFLFPLFAYYIGSFFRSSWYGYQFNLYKKFVLNLFFVFLICFFLVHYTIFPSVFSFFTHWEIKEESSLLRIETETTLVSYIAWILIFKAFFCFFLTLLVFIITNFLYFVKIEQLYPFVKTNKRIFLLLFIICSFLLTPPDFFTQVFIVFGNFLIFDVLFFHVCTKLYRTKFIQNGKNNTK